MSVYTSESPETLTDTVQCAHAVNEECLERYWCNEPRDYRTYNVVSVKYRTLYVLL